MAGIAAEVELNRSLGGMTELRLAEDGLGFGQRSGAASRVGEGDPGSGVGGLAADELGGDGAKLDSVTLLAEDNETETEDLIAVGRSGGKLVEFGGGLGEEAEFDVAAGVGQKPARLHRCDWPAGLGGLEQTALLVFATAAAGAGVVAAGFGGGLNGGGTGADGAGVDPTIGAAAKFGALL